MMDLIYIVVYIIGAIFSYGALVGDKPLGEFNDAGGTILLLGVTFWPITWVILLMGYIFLFFLDLCRENDLFRKIFKIILYPFKLIILIIQLPYKLGKGANMKFHKQKD